MVTITPVAIEPGGDTGTAVSKTIQSMRAQVSGLETKLAANAQRLADLRNAGAGSSRLLSGIQGPDHHPASGRHHQGQS